MYTARLDADGRAYCAAATFIFAVTTGINVSSWLLVVYDGQLPLSTLFASGLVILFTIRV
jgi:heme/copper-type cytochrome/quinol oxidase subunit 1